MYTTKREILDAKLSVGDKKVLLKALLKLSPEAIEVAIDEAGLKAKRSNGFAADFYEFLAEKVRSEKEALGFILGSGEYEGTSKNVKAHESHYLNIAALVTSVRANLKK